VSVTSLDVRGFIFVIVVFVMDFLSSSCMCSVFESSQYRCLVTFCLYQFPYCRRLVGGGDLCAVPSVLSRMNKPVTKNGTEIGTVLLVGTLRGSSGTQ
jgi:hypothetical protein